MLSLDEHLEKNILPKSAEIFKVRHVNKRNYTVLSNVPVIRQLPSLHAQLK